MLNEYHDVRWSKEFGNGRYTNDSCPDAVISEDGFVVYVIGYTFNFTGNPIIDTTDIYLL